MRGEWGEFNPWQVAMGKSTQAVLEDSGVDVYRADSPEEVPPTVIAGAKFAYQTGRSVAVLIGALHGRAGLHKVPRQALLAQPSVRLAEIHRALNLTQSRRVGEGKVSVSNSR